MPFLDINIKRGEIFDTSVYRKPTFTGFYTHFTSFVPVIYKFNLAKCLLTRAYKICSSLLSVHTEFEFISKLLSSNGFPRNIIQRSIKTVLDNAHKSTPTISTVKKKDLTLYLLFTGKHGLIVKSRLKRLFKLHFPMANLRIIFIPAKKISHLFPFKDRVATVMQSLVVYKFRCTSCNAQYVGNH